MRLNHKEKQLITIVCIIFGLLITGMYLIALYV